MQQTYSEESIRQIVSKNLRLFRTTKKLSQVKLSEISGITHNYINDIENCKKSASLETIAKLANALDVEPYTFFLSDSMSDYILAYLNAFNDNVHQFVSSWYERYNLLVKEK